LLRADQKQIASALDANRFVQTCTIDCLVPEYGIRGSRHVDLMFIRPSAMIPQICSIMKPTARELKPYIVCRGMIHGFLGDKLVSWMSKKQNCTAMSSAEVEYVALSAICAQVMWMRTQLQDYGFNYNKIPLYGFTEIHTLSINISLRDC
ncbi:hypothetical protein Tco_1529162, partial [Tanacetum coccineum]